MCDEGGERGRGVKFRYFCVTSFVDGPIYTYTYTHTPSVEKPHSEVSLQHHTQNRQERRLIEELGHH